ncbi:MAG: phosphatase PAP2 family protein [Thermoleophilia bacterium]|jgi:hypothetical protein|nr:phosphatase PAP2 family protein [Thermoleophilia bacterium]
MSRVRHPSREDLLDRARRATRPLTFTRSGRVELLVIAVAYAAYELVRGLAGGSLAEGQANVAPIIDIQRAFGLDFERGWHEAVGGGFDAEVWSWIYLFAQAVAFPLMLAVVWAFRREAYALVRNVLLVVWASALVVYALFPLAPPRLAGLGFGDTVSTYAADLDSPLIRAFYNPVAAMPSLHVAVAVMIGWCLFSLARHPALRALGLVWPPVVATATIVTANHWVLDAIAGLALVLVAAALVRLVSPQPAYEPAVSEQRQ